MDIQKYKIIDHLENDAPFGCINWCTISFLTPHKLNNLKLLDVRGFKVHDGYNSEELALSDAQKIKSIHTNHDVYVCQLGKIHAWDDNVRADNVQYDNRSLNDLEKTRKENMDKVKLMNEQLANDVSTNRMKSDKYKAEKLRKSLHQKLHQSGKITHNELKLINENVQSHLLNESEIVQLNDLLKEVETVKTTDYLLENELVGLKYGCISIFTPRKLHNLKIAVFKIRGLFQTLEELQLRINYLIELYPDDRLYTFEIGKWCAFSETDSLTSIELNNRLNYAMKCYLDSLDSEEKEFKHRKESMVPEETTASIKKKVKTEPKKAVEVNSLGNDADDLEIRQLAHYLNDPQLANIYPANNVQTTVVNLN